MAVQYHTGKFPPNNIEWRRLIPLIGPATASLARYDGTLQSVPNAKLLLSPLITQEAVLSSRIEGTVVNLEEVLEYDADKSASNLNENKRSEIPEVWNYRKALIHATNMLDKLPLSLRVVKESHAILLKDVRGQFKSPGSFRTIQNFIGNSDKIEEAKFIPIQPNVLIDGLN